MSTQKQIIEDFKKRFGVSLIAAKDRLEIGIAYNQADEEKANSYIESFLCKELSIYSTNVLKRSRLSSIILCKNLASLGEKKAGLADLKMIGFRKLLGNRLFIDVETPQNSYTRAVIHHELYHSIDNSDDFNGLYDNQWKKLNHPKFTYKDDLPVNQEHEAETGFISTYAMTAVHEDKAEMFCHMIVDYSGTEKRAKEDNVLRRKMERMKQLMSDFCSEFDDEFWKKRARESVSLKLY